MTSQDVKTAEMLRAVKVELRKQLSHLIGDPIPPKKLIAIAKKIWEASFLGCQIKDIRVEGQTVLATIVLPYAKFEVDLKGGKDV
jgi:hypothetical protein